MAARAKAKSYKSIAVQYAKDVVSGKHLAGGNVRECRRFLDDLERDDLELRPKDPDLVINIIQQIMVHNQGEALDGTPLVPVVDDELQELDYVTELKTPSFDTTGNEFQTWTLEVYNATTGEKVFCQEVDGTNYIIETMGWKPGVYIVRAIIGDEVLNEKVIVK